MAITFAWLLCAAQSKHAHLLVAGFGRWQLNGKTVHQVALPYHYGTAGLVRGGAANDLLPFPVSRMSRSWKPRRLPATSCLDVCRVDQRSLNFLTNMHRKLGQRSCIQKSVLSEKDKAAGATQSKEKNENASKVAHAARLRAKTALASSEVRASSHDRRRHTQYESAPAHVTCATTLRLVSSLIRLYASVAKPAKSRAKNGTKCPMTASFGQAIPTTTPVISAHPRGVT